MIFLLFSILSSSALMIIFKYFDRFNVKTFDAIVVNYFVASGLSILLDTDEFSISNSIEQPWFFNSIVIGILFIALFNVIAISIQKIGVSVTTVANKMSLIIPVMFAVLMLGDSINAVKIAGIVIALVAVYLTSVTDASKHEEIDKRYALFPLIVFISSGFIDSFFKYNQTYTLGENGVKPFITWIFITASIIGLFVLIINYFKTKSLPNYKSILGGIILGIPNYGSIYFLMKCLSIESIQSSVVFPVNNMSIVAVSALAGILLFQERITKINALGVLLCLIAIAVIAFSEEIMGMIV
jgi:drug/metabolite transporter (DMT)-like permease